MEEKKVFAVVNGVEITEDDFEYMLERLGPERGSQFRNPQGQQALVYELVNQEVLYQDALKKGLDRSEEYQKMVEQNKKDILKSLAVEKLIADVKVSDEEAKAYYDANVNDFRVGESVKASHILVDNEEIGKKVLEELENGKPFNEVALAYSTCPSAQQGGDLGYFSRGRMVKEFEDAAFQLKVGERSGLVKSQFGYHVILVTDKRDENVIPFEEVKENLKNNLEAVRRNEEYARRCNELRKEYDIQMK